MRTIIFFKPKILLSCALILCMQVLANLLSAPLASGSDGNTVGWPYVAFDLNPSVVKVRKSYMFQLLYFNFGIFIYRILILCKMLI